MDHKTKQELNQMSLEVFGTSSKWQKLVNDGVKDPMERDREVMVPRANGELIKKTFTDRKYVIRRFTVDEVRTLMQGILDGRKPKEVPEAVVEASPAETTEAAKG